MMHELILASSSKIRRKLFENAGLTFRCESARIDERIAEKPLIDAGGSAEDIALVLAQAKAEDVSLRNENSWVIGSDQTLSLDGEILHKVDSMDEARRRLLQLSGKLHHLNSAVAIMRNGELVWSHVSVADMSMHNLDPGYIGRYLSRAGQQVLSSVGVYQIESLGIQLFRKIEGDTFTIMGLPLLPLLSQLRELGLIDG